MRFDAKAYGERVAEVLALDGDGERLIPLVQERCSSEAARERLQAAKAQEWFAGARAAEAALAGLYVYFSCWDDAHKVAQDLGTPEGSYWHAIVHRQEPDAGNSSYWFRQVGEHPVYEPLAARAAEIGLSLGRRWDPYAFIRVCEEARRAPGSDRERQALEVQRAEWQLLFDYCARK